MWHGASKSSPDGTRYTARQLEFLLYGIACEFELEDDNAPTLGKDAECRIHSSEVLAGITNGEYAYTAVTILKEMMSDEPATAAPLYKEAVLASLLDIAFTDLLDEFPHNFNPSQAQDAWELWKACRSNHTLPVWEAKGAPADPPALKSLSAEGWSWMFAFIARDLVGECDWESKHRGKSFALFPEQPHWPTFQEYRTAKVWLRQALANAQGSKLTLSTSPYYAAAPQVPQRQKARKVTRKAA